MRCKKCRKRLTEDSTFCKYCGENLRREHLEDEKGGKRIKADTPKQPENTPKIQKNMSTLIGKNSKYYLKEFRALESGKRISFNIGVFIGGPLIPLYRKCILFFVRLYLPFLLVTVSYLIVTRTIFLNDMQRSLFLLSIDSFIRLVFLVWGIILFTVGGLDFNAYYYARIKRLAAK